MTVRLAVDMSLSPEWSTVLTDAGYPALHWSSVGNPAAPDREIMDWARGNGYAVFTHDLDFSTALALTHAGRPSVIQIRGVRVLPEHIGIQLIDALRRFSADLEAGAPVVVEPARSRVRVLPLQYHGLVGSDVSFSVGLDAHDASRVRVADLGHDRTRRPACRSAANPIPLYAPEVLKADSRRSAASSLTAVSGSRASRRRRAGVATPP
jgi:predicted nuclease of predicted toxin-antitoxin system